MDQLDVGVALHEHEAAPVAQQGGERRVRDAALDGAVAPVVARRVQVLGHRSAAWDTESFQSCRISPSPKTHRGFATSILL